MKIARSNVQRVIGHAINIHVRQFECSTGIHVRRFDCSTGIFESSSTAQVKIVESDAAVF